MAPSRPAPVAPRFIASVAPILCLVSACATAGGRDVRDGDIVFHTSTSSQSEALRRATGSPYTHMGLVFLDRGNPVVLEAVGPVKLTPLDEWIDRGVGRRYVVKRLRDADARLTPDAVERLRAAAERYLGLPYDPYFEWSDERIYCSELVWKAYREALGLEIGRLQRFDDFDLSDPVVAAKLRERFGAEVPTAAPVISPASMFAAPELLAVHER